MKTKTKSRGRLKVVHLSDFPVDRFKKQALIARDLQTVGLFADVSVIHVKLPPRSALPDIHHKRTAELVYCLSGRMTGRLNGKDFSLRPGNVIYIPPGAWHRFSTKGGSEALAIFQPPLSISKHSDVCTRAGVELWD